MSKKECPNKHGIFKLQEFWNKESDSLIWEKKWHRVLEGDLCSAKWFVGGKIDLYKNLVEKHSGKETWNKIAIITERESGENQKMTYAGLHKLASEIASGLGEIGLKAGDWILIHSPPNFESIAVILSATKLGCPFEVVFTGFGWQEVAKRIELRKPMAIFTVEAFQRNGKIVEPIKILRKALESVKFKTNLFLLEDLEEILSKEFIGSAIFNTQDQLFGLHVGYEEDFKPLTFPAGGFLVQNIATAKMLEIAQKDIVFCMIWHSWITGLAYGIFAPLMLGSTILCYEGAPNYPNWNRTSELIEKHGATILITAGAILKLFSEKMDKDGRSKMETLKSILSTPEQFDEETLRKIKNFFGDKIPVRIMFIQGELGSFVTLNSKLNRAIPGYYGKEMPGFLLDVIDEKGNSIRDAIGKLVLRTPWPAMPLETEFRERLKEGFYDTMNLGMISKDGSVFAFGRRDIVLRINGYRLSPGAIENAVEGRALVFGIKDESGNEFPVVIAEGSEEEVKRKISERFGAFLTPLTIIRVAKIPEDKNRVRRKLKENLRKSDLRAVYEILGEF
ncbi:MAG: AMP-binding protein [Archaeoglobaceae archaeon]|nr:AMP-binding protein [Archaeoglobaceae archaeon]MDW8117540.1 AMP-binding protein [Archaeoglobaceae archaeon]